jgi:hypothetical protein
MEHPLVSGLDQLTEEQLSERINDLHHKLTMAMRTGNGHLCNQVRMVLESHQSRLRFLQEEKHRSGNDKTHFDKIDIS